MPKLLPSTEKIRGKRFLKALEETGSTAEAAKKVLKIGSKGSKDINNSASAAGSQMLARIKPELIAALEREGVTTTKIAKKVNFLLDQEFDGQLIDKGITQAMKMGLGGGYQKESKEPEGNKTVVAIQVILNGEPNAQAQDRTNGETIQSS